MLKGMTAPTPSGVIVSTRCRLQAGPNESFDDGQAFVLLDRSETLMDTPASAPAAKAAARELPAVVGDQMTRTGTCRADGPAEEGFDSRTGRLVPLLGL